MFTSYNGYLKKTPQRSLISTPPPPKKKKKKKKKLENFHLPPQNANFKLPKVLFTFFPSNIRGLLFYNVSKGLTLVFSTGYRPPTLMLDACLLHTMGTFCLLDLRL